MVSGAVIARAKPEAIQCVDVAFVSRRETISVARGKARQAMNKE